MHTLESLVMGKLWREIEVSVYQAEQLYSYDAYMRQIATVAGLYQHKAIKIVDPQEYEERRKVFVDVIAVCVQALEWSERDANRIG